MTSSVFSQMASLVTVRDVQTPLGPDVNADTPALHATEELFDQSCDGGYNAIDRISLAVELGRPIGWFTADLLDVDGPEDARPVRDLMESIAPSEIISATTSLFDAVDHFSTEDSSFFFVLDGRRITGTLHYSDLFKPPGLLCFFGLTLHLESSALELCSRTAEECWNALLASRQDKARKVYRHRYNARPRRFPSAVVSESFQEWLACTMFIDKATMIVERNLLGDQSRETIEAVFRRAEQVRNACAHPTDADDLTLVLHRNDLGAFLRDCHGLISLIEEAIPAD